MVEDVAKFLVLRCTIKPVISLEVGIVKQMHDPIVFHVSGAEAGLVHVGIIVGCCNANLLLLIRCPELDLSAVNVARFGAL